jgi:hypothetical protein
MTGGVLSDEFLAARRQEFHSRANERENIKRWRR